MFKKSILISFLSIMFITACASPEDYAIPEGKPLTEQEKETMSCRDIAIDIQSSKSILEELGGGATAAKTGASAAIGMFGVALGAFDTTAISRGMAHNKAAENTQKRLDELEALALEKNCTPEEMNIGGDDAPKGDTRISRQ